MSTQRLSKTELQNQRRQLGLYRKLLPSLEMKRRLLSAELKRARDELVQSENRFDALREAAAAGLPMIANPEIPLNGLVRVERAVEAVANIAGVRVPIPGEIVFVRRDYSLLTRPAWLDALVETLEHLAGVEFELGCFRRRVELLEAATRRMTQRVNLFERVLIPRAEAAIRRLQIFLGDQDREAVVRAKLAKQRLQARSLGRSLR